MSKTLYETGGFAFPSKKMMEKAEKEAEGIRFVKSSADLKDPRVVYGVYCQMVKQELFETPIGYAFLYELQENLKADLSINNEDIPAIPVITNREASPKGGSAKEQSQTPPNRKTAHKPEVKNVDYKVKFKTSVSVCVILLFIIIGMFAVTFISKNNINILNYENAVIEKYENWETELKEREEKLRERELNQVE